jgi:hypothetical protein
MLQLIIIVMSRRISLRRSKARLIISLCRMIVSKMVGAALVIVRGKRYRHWNAAAVHSHKYGWHSRISPQFISRVKTSK